MCYSHVTSKRIEKCMRNDVVKVLGVSFDILYIFSLLLFQTQTGFANGVGDFEAAHPVGRSPSSFFEDTSHMSWDNLDLQFLNMVRDSSLHRKNEFHVINATFKSESSINTSYVIHLSKPEGLFYLDHLNFSESETQEMRCLFSGTISEITEDHRHEPKHGIVSLSSCHHEIGFEGLILLPHQQYYIQPHFAPEHIHQRLFRRTVDQKPLVSHKAYKINEKTSPIKAGHVDDALIPPPELLKKAKEKAANIDHFEDEDDGFQDLEENMLMEDDGSDHNAPSSGASPLVAKAKKSSKTSKTGKSGKNNKKQTTKSQNTGSTKIIEIAVFVDHHLYKIFKSRYGNNAKSKLNQYVLAVINNMNALYKQPSMTEKITFSLVNVEIQTSKPSIINEHHADAEKYLTSFCNYEAEKNSKGQLWDHGLLLTGLDLKQHGSNGVAGIAWLSTMCINTLSCSLIEAYNFNSAFITTHEIGHNIGMEHDGEGPNRGCDSNSYIMSPTTGGGKTDWSKCSVSNMKNFLNNGYQWNPPPKCVFKKGARAGNAIKFTSSKLPGQQFDADTQCAAVCTGCVAHTQAPYNDICYLLHCRPAKVSFIFTVTGLHPALEGTTCAKGKMCRVGKCV